MAKIIGIGDWATQASPPSVHILPAPTREPELPLFSPLAFNGTWLFEQPAKERD